MGGVDNICTDKTGTLTQNKMKVASLYSQGKIYSNSDVKNLNKNTMKLICDGYVFFGKFYSFFFIGYVIIALLILIFLRKGKKQKLVIKLIVHCWSFVMKMNIII